MSSDDTWDLVVIGCGPGGEKAAAQAALAGGVGQGLHPAVILETITVEDDRRNACSLRRFGDSRADSSCRALVATMAIDLHRLRRRGHEGLAGIVVDDLGVDVVAAAEDAETRALCTSTDLLANPNLPAQSRGVTWVGLLAHDLPYAPDFPALRRTCSPR